MVCVVCEATFIVGVRNAVTCYYCVSDTGGMFNFNFNMRATPNDRY